MNTKSVPAIIMLLAGFTACIAGMNAHMEVADFLKMLLIVLIVFYILGCMIEYILDKHFVVKKETTDGENTNEETNEEETNDEGIETDTEESEDEE